MGIRFITGRSGSGKTQICLDEMSKKQTENLGKQLILIVPEQFSLQAERDLISKTNGKGIMQARVLSFRRLAFNIFAETGIEKNKNLDDIGKLMSLKKILIDNKDKLTYFKKSIDKQGFINELSNSITELFQYNITPKDLEDVLSNGDDSLNNGKLKDILLIYKCYLSFLKDNYISSDETLDILVSKINRAGLIKGSEVWIDGFHGFTPQEYKVINELLIYSSQVNITLTIDKNLLTLDPVSVSSLFYETNTSYKRLINLAKRSNVEIIDTLYLPKPLRFNSETLNALEKGLTYNITYKKTSDDISIYAADNKYNEVEYTANRIISLVRDKGYRYKEIAVVMRTVDSYKSTIKSVFTEYNIPFFIDSKRSISSHPLVILILSAIEIVLYDFSYESVFRYLKSGLIKISYEDIEKLENYVLAYGIKGYKWHFNEWTFGFKDSHSEEKESINLIKENVLKPLMPFVNRINKNKYYSVKDITLELFDLLDRLDITSNINEWIESCKINKDMEMANIHEQCLNITLETFEKMLEILDNISLSLNEYIKVLTSGLHNADIGIIPPGVDNLTIGDIERTRLPDIKALFVLGVNDGILPSPVKNSGILNDDERILLEKNGLSLSSTGKRKMFEEQFLIYSGLTKTTDYLSLSYILSELNGKAMLPSMLINKIKKIFPLMNECKDDSIKQNEINSISTIIPAFHKLGKNLKGYTIGETIDNIWIDIFNYLKNDNAWGLKIKMITDGLNSDIKDSYIDKSFVQNQYKDNMISSVSRLEKFAQCPFSYFAKYTLNANERKLYKLETPDLGTLFHSVLEKFSQEIEDKSLDWKSLDEKNIGNMVDKIVNLVAPTLNNEVLLSSNAHNYLIKRLKRVSKRAVWALVFHLKSGTFNPIGFEIGFGKKEKLPPIIIELNNGLKVMITGKVDRVDILTKDNRQYIKIIDYKSGKKQFNLQEVYYGMQLQLLIYMEALINSSTDDKVHLPGGVFYFRINDPMLSASEDISTDEIERLLLKEFKMSGLILMDKEVITGMDSAFESSSDIIPVSIKKDGSLKSSSSSLSLADYRSLINFSHNKAKELGEEILNGNIEISPYKSKEQTACSYCPYKSICKFDPSVGNNYRTLRQIKDDEILLSINS